MQYNGYTLEVKVNGSIRGFFLVDFRNLSENIQQISDFYAGRVHFRIGKV